MVRKQRFTLKLVLVSVLMISSNFATARAGPAPGIDEQTIRQLNEDWLKAYDAGDVAALDRIEADGFTVAGEFGERTKQQQLDEIRKRAEKAQAGNREIAPQQFRFYGDVALVTETDHYSSTGGSDDYCSTSIWIRHGGTWKVVNLHFSRLAK